MNSGTGAENAGNLIAPNAELQVSLLQTGQSSVIAQPVARQQSSPPSLLSAPAASAWKVEPGLEVIPGYVLRQPIGRGGFGEVWKAEAPGGLLKAIKLVFGALDDRRAGRELRSLENMRGVSHPFLLTVERYDIVDNRLLIVCELADGSLEDVFQRQIKRGSCGIPRDVLLAYLHDAADALDYLHQQFQLQHLDVKPGNLLLVGGHVKVADFGLMKDLSSIDQSMISGLTPIYAPPEIFDGKPSVNSDQYSLAVMYQELLTSTRPFLGRTMAQLAMQHLHATPDLSALPAADRPVIARALEKNPESRYSSCKELIDALMSKRLRSSAVLGRGGRVAIDATTSSTETHCQHQPVVDQLPELNASQVSNREPQAADVLVVGIGGMGADVLLELQHKFDQQQTLPPLRLHSVLIDTDAERLHRMRILEGPDSRSPCQTLNTPLKSPSEYRAAGTESLGSISRRWIYNVPRSRSTERLRPLGRLAMVSHGPKITKCLRETIQQILNSDSNLPTVFVTGSLAGGTGSGMLIDMIYVLRSLLDELGCEESEVIPLLAVPAECGQATDALRCADAAAAMQELLHFLKPENGYPGDVGAGFARVPAARSPLNNTYLLAESETNVAEENSTVVTLADYMWLSVLGHADILSAARAADLSDQKSSMQNQPVVRSVGISRFQQQQTSSEISIASIISSDLLSNWLGDVNATKRVSKDSIDRYFAHCGITPEAIYQAGWRKTSEYLSEALPDIGWRVKKVRLGGSASDNALLETLGPYLQELRECSVVNAEAESGFARFRSDLAVRLQDRRLTLSEMQAVVEQLRQLLDQCLAQVMNLPAGCESLLSKEDSALKGLHAILIQRMEQSFQLELEQGIRDSLVHLRALVTDFAAAIAAKSDQLAVGLDQENLRVQQNVSQLFPEEVTQWLSHVREQLHNELICPIVIQPMMNPAATEDQHACLDLLKHHVQMLADKAPPQVTGAADAEADNFLRRQVSAFMAAARPALLDYGGRQRLILITGCEEERKRLAPIVQQVYGHPMTALVVPNSATMLLHEAQEIPLSSIQKRMEDTLGGHRKLVSRLLSRVDIDWS